MNKYSIKQTSADGSDDYDTVEASSFASTPEGIVFHNERGQQVAWFSQHTARSVTPVIDDNDPPLPQLVAEQANQEAPGNGFVWNIVGSTIQHQGYQIASFFRLMGLSEAVDADIAGMMHNLVETHNSRPSVPWTLNADDVLTTGGGMLLVNACERCSEYGASDSQRAEVRQQLRYLTEYHNSIGSRVTGS